jgi:uncharacterized cupredoxin-like copper-binding protein
MRREQERILSVAIVVGLAWIGAASAEAADWTKARLVTVVTVEYRFQPDHLVFRRGVAYRLHVVNRGHELHELTAPDFFKTVELRDPEALNPEQTELVLQPGDRKDLYFVAKRPGHYDMRCADHDWAGMTGDITVK